MKLILESSYIISNNVRTYCEYDDFILREIDTIIFLDISQNLSEDEFYEREAKGDDMTVEIGKIQSTKFDIKFEESILYTVADSNNADIEKIVAYFLYGKGKQNLKKNYIFPDVLYYINKVIIKSEYRGHNYGLYALALLLESMAEGQIVACHPHPINTDNIEPVGNGYIVHYTDENDCPEIKKEQKLLRRYWSKVGLDYYDKDHNILWTNDWTMPKWIRKKLFNCNYG